MAENKIVDLERLKDYSLKLKEHFIAEEIKVKDESKRYDSEDVEAALKEISERTGYAVNSSIERTATTGNAYAANTGATDTFGAFDILDGETYTITVNGVDYETTSWMTKGEVVLGAATISDWSTCPIQLRDSGWLYGSPNTTYTIKITGKLPTYGDERLISPYIRKGQNNRAVRLNYAQEASAWGALAAGPGAIASGETDIAMGYYAKTSGGGYSVAIGDGATAEAEYGDALAIGGCDNEATNYGATVIGGQENIASGEVSFASGWKTKSIGYGTHTEGNYTVAGNAAAGRTLDGSHAEGNYASATGIASHAEGDSTKAFGEAGTIPTEVIAAHAEGSFTEAGARYSHAEGALTVAAAKAQHVQGIANVADTDKKFADIIGNGTYHVSAASSRGSLVADERRNISATTWSGDQILHGDVYVGASYDSTGGQKLLRPSEMGIPAYDATKTYAVNVTVYEPTTDKFYKCKTAITEAAGAFDSTKWTEIKFGDGYLTRHNPTGTGSLSINRSATGAVGDCSVAIGKNNKATGTVSIAIGDSNNVTDELGVAIGKINTVGQNGYALGRMNTVSNQFSLAEGFNNTVSGYCATAIGRDSTVTSNYGISAGIENTVSASFGTSLGSYNEIKTAAQHGVALGDRLKVSSNKQLVFGYQNVEDAANQYKAILGNGRYNEGAGEDVRLNLEATTVTGDKKLKGDVYVHAEDDSSGGIRLSTPDVLAAYFDASTAYTAGSYVTNKDDGCLYKAKADITAGTWNASKWDKITVAQAIATGSAASDEVSEINLDGRALDVIDEGEFYAANTTVEDALQALPGITCAAFDKARVYNVGDFVIKNGALYKANAAHAAGEVFIDTKWDKTTIVENLGSGEYATKEDVDNAFDDIFGL